MKILAFVNKNSGPSYHRIIMPLLLMKDADVFITNDLQEHHFADKQPDYFMYNRILPEEAMHKVIELQEKYGFQIIVDIDDYWELDPHHILYDEYHAIDFASQQRQHINNADIVFTTHSRLAAEIAKINPNVHVLPNAIPHSGQFDIVKEPHYLIRLFWQGSITHGSDIAILKSPIHQLASLSGKIKMVMAGYNEVQEWHDMAEVYTGGFKHQYLIIEGAPVTNYYAAYAQADICLVPLVKSPFNGHKSNLKVLEAANLGLPVIASKCDPYLDMPVLYARNPTDWVKHIKKLVDSRNRRRDAGAELKEWVDREYNFHSINRERKQILEYQLSKA